MGNPDLKAFALASEIAAAKSASPGLPPFAIVTAAEKAAAPPGPPKYAAAILPTI